MANNNGGNNRFCNDEAKITFMSKSRERRTTTLSNVTINNIKDGILHGLEYCRRRRSDCDMFVVLQGNKVIPNARSLTVQLGDTPASMEASSDGSLRFVTTEGFCLHVMFIGGGSIWVLADADSEDSLEVENFTQLMNH